MCTKCNLQKNACNEEARRHAVNESNSDQMWMDGVGRPIWTNSLSRE